MSSLVLKRASASRHPASGTTTISTCSLGAVVGRIMKAAAVPIGMSWMWTLAFGYHEDRTPTHGYGPTREAAMAAGVTARARRADRQVESGVDRAWGTGARRKMAACTA